MLIKDRVRRLLSSGKKSRFVKDLDTLTTVSESLSEEYEDDDDNEEDSKPPECLVEYEDPYADVREAMEALSAHDRAKYALRAYATPRTTKGSSYESPRKHEVIWWVAYTCYLAYAVLLMMAHIRDFCGWLFGNSRYARNKINDPRWYAPLLGNWERMYTNRIYNRLQDCFNRPIGSYPGVLINVLERVSSDGYKSMQLLGPLKKQPSSVRDDYRGSVQSGLIIESNIQKYPKKASEKYRPVAARRCLNLGSYNYLGFADDWQETCGDTVRSTMQNFGVGSTSSLQEFGYTVLHRQVEETVAEFVGKEDAICLNMGFSTNATILPALVGPADLIVSDALNHTSIVNGARASGAAIRIFRHNDMRDLDSILKQAIVLGRPRTRRPWRKILVIVEGVYSMEGVYCDLRSVVQLCRQYGAYVYLDEAHSIGAMGATGRGCCEYCGVDPSQVDILMGTFTKSFCGMGGYIAADRGIIAHLRRACSASVFHTAMSPLVCQQVLKAFHVIMGKDGTDIGKKKLQALRDNSNYFRMRCQEMGLQVLGHYDSPVIPVMLYHMSKIAAFSRECFKRGLAVVVVGAPAVPLLECRARFCMSAALNRSQLDEALMKLEEIVDICQIRTGTKLSPVVATSGQ